MFVGQSINILNNYKYIGLTCKNFIVSNRTYNSLPYRLIISISTELYIFM